MRSYIEASLWQGLPILIGITIGLSTVKPFQFDKLLIGVGIAGAITLAVGYLNHRRDKKIQERHEEALRKVRELRKREDIANG